MRLIDADETVETLYACIQLHKNYATLYRPFENGYIAGLENAIKILKSGTPAIEAEPVRHGRWREVSRYRDENGYIVTDQECSECLGMSMEVPEVDDGTELPRYCMMCGAKMDAKEVAENDT